MHDLSDMSGIKYISRVRAPLSPPWLEDHGLANQTFRIQVVAHGTMSIPRALKLRLVAQKQGTSGLVYRATTVLRIELKPMMTGIHLSTYRTALLWWENRGLRGDFEGRANGYLTVSTFVEQR